MRDGERKWLSGWLADEIERQTIGVDGNVGKVSVDLRPAQWRAAIARLRALARVDVSSPPDAKED